MANITIQIPDAMMPRVVEAFTKQFNYQDQVLDQANPGAMIANPETKNQFTQRQIRDYIKNTVGMQEGLAASAAAAEKARNDLG